VRQSGERARRKAAGNRFSVLHLLAPVFLLFVIAAAFSDHLPRLVFWLYLLASVVTFLAYMLDKFAAIRGRRRIRESTLHLFALAGGWPGALSAQRVFRHKTRKKSFQMVFWLTVGLNGSALAVFVMYGSAGVLR
jgi:uncharacterized membrane protein YsdA (DUF1294 family)